MEWSKNPRLLTKKQATDLTASLTKFGYADPIILNADGKNIIGGHQRRRMLLAQALVNPNMEVDVRIPSRQLTSEEASELAIRLNRNQGEWDFDRLANEFDVKELIDWGFEPNDFGIEHPALTEAATEPPGQVEEKSIRIKHGETWLIGSNGTKITCGQGTNDPRYCEVALRSAESMNYEVKKAK